MLSLVALMPGLYFRGDFVRCFIFGPPFAPVKPIMRLQGFGWLIWGYPGPVTPIGKQA